MRDDSIQGIHYDPVDLTDGQRLIIAMLADLAQSPENRQIDHEFIAQAVSSGQSWSVRWKYSHLLNNDGEMDPVKVRSVARNFTMWRIIERSVDNWNNEEKGRYREKVAEYDHDPKYKGYDGNNEDECSIAHHMVEELGRFSEFSGRSHNAHMLTAEIYGRMEAAFNDIWSQRDTVRDAILSPDEVALIINAKNI